MQTKIALLILILLAFIACKEHPLPGDDGNAAPKAYKPIGQIIEDSGTVIIGDSNRLQLFNGFLDTAQRITIHGDSMSLPLVMQIIEAETSFYCSWDSDLRGDFSKISLDLKNGTLIECLQQILWKDKRLFFVIVGSNIHSKLKPQKIMNGEFMFR